MATLFAMQSQQDLGFAQLRSLTEEYRPRRVQDFIGIAKPRKVLTNLLQAPRSCALLFVGEPGCGKTSLALAFSEELGADLHHLASAQCNLAALEETVRACNYIPRSGLNGFHVVLVDEADSASDAAQKYLLSKLDATGMLQNTIWIFTANSVDRLEERFLSRTMKLDFSSHGSGKDISAFLERIWREKAPQDAEAPDFTRLANSNVRESLMRLDVALLSC